MKKVLLYEPSKSFALFLKYVLSRLSYQVFHVDNADAIIGTIETTKPDLIIAESNVKYLGGLDLCRRLKDHKAFSGIPVAIISVDGSTETREAAQQAGCVDYLTKPLTARSIHELMERQLPFHNKRKTMRARLQVDAKIVSNARSESVKTLNIGAGGMYACTDQPLEVGTLLDVVLPLPSLVSPLELNGEVVHAVRDQDAGLPRGMGIKFLEMGNNTVTLFKHYMESYVSDFAYKSSSGESGRFAV